MTSEARRECPLKRNPWFDFPRIRGSWNREMGADEVFDEMRESGNGVGSESSEEGAVKIRMVGIGLDEVRVWGGSKSRGIGCVRCWR